jgi:CrcB protein
MSFGAWIAFVAAGAIGAPLRYLIDSAITDHGPSAFPWGTLIVNATGSFLLGVITGLALYHAFPATSRLVLGGGFCGAYTTFSTFTFETVRLAEEGGIGEAALNIALTVAICATSAAAGLALANL